MGAYAPIGVKLLNYSVTKVQCNPILKRVSDVPTKDTKTEKGKNEQARMKVRKIGLPRETIAVLCCVVTEEYSPLPNPSHLWKNRSIRC